VTPDSDVEPFALHIVDGHGAGQIAVCRQPGQSGDLVGDLQIINDWTPTHVVTMTTEAEFPTGLPHAFGAADFEWLHLPIADFGAPHARDAALFRAALTRLGHELAHDKRIVIHCRGGLGRSGMMALRLLIEQGEPPHSALHRLRLARDGAVETKEQYVWAISDT